MRKNELKRDEKRPFFFQLFQAKQISLGRRNAILLDGYFRVAVAFFIRGKEL